ncbi:hypothetical protein [Flavobacteriaceae bacterium 14752]|uniref:hypothetical protein n=1 Tax=Mesohalobacter salilacus TaxID=2491711 RepID=UPI000F637B5E|nr:hypothetical protein EIG84_12335 [Flavobacteriaceae bacterium 14752]
MITFDEYKKIPNVQVDIIEEIIRANKKYYEYNGYKLFFDRYLSTISDDKSFFYKKGVNVYEVKADIYQGKFLGLTHITDKNLKQYKHIPRYDELKREVRQYKLNQILN